MAIPVVERAVLDTNVLLAATDEARVDHEQALVALNDWPAAGAMLYSSGQILREYLAVATRPVTANGLGLSRPDAVANVRAFRARLTVLGEDRRVSEQLLQLLDRVACSGKQVHDANIVATMLVHGVGTVVTANTDDFKRFAKEVLVLNLLAT